MTSVISKEVTSQKMLHSQCQQIGHQSKSYNKEERNYGIHSTDKKNNKIWDRLTATAEQGNGDEDILIILL